ncbi:hypothetical protein ACFQ2B_35930 [Streptomyces stramineus]|uniref:Transposase n=1 Tax=Streptomyces stramineus TaxID=173861 RepID=A0ABN0ZCM6_9ACTN
MESQAEGVVPVLAAMSGMEREYIPDRTFEVHESARKRGKTIGGAGRHRRVHEVHGSPPTRPGVEPANIAKRLVVTTGTKKGQRSAPATVMRMLRKHDEKAATEAGA